MGAVGHHCSTRSSALLANTQCCGPGRCWDCLGSSVQMGSVLCEQACESWSLGVCAGVNDSGSMCVMCVPLPALQLAPHSQVYRRLQTKVGQRTPIVLPELLGTPPCRISLPSRKPASKLSQNLFPDTQACYPCSSWPELSPTARSSQHGAPPWPLENSRNRLVHPLQSGLWLATPGYRHIREPLFPGTPGYGSPPVLCVLSVSNPSPTGVAARELHPG